MNKLILLFTLAINIQAQSWIEIVPQFDPPGDYNTCNGTFVDENHGWWMAGPNASVFYTTNGGTFWKEQHNNIALSRIEFVDTLHGWIIGESLPDHQSYILITKNGGKNWDKYTAPLLGCITFSDSLNGFAGGVDNIYSTTDGGINWHPQEIEPGVRFGIMDIYFIDDKNGWAVGGSSDAWDAGIILNTTDGGKYWKVNEHPSGITGYRVYFTDSLHGYVVGANPPICGGMIKVTSDGGVNWKSNYLPCTWLNDVVFVNDSTGWAVGDYGFIWHTSDRGVTWEQIESGTTSHLYRIFFFNNGEVGYILGDNRTLMKYDTTVGIKDKSEPITTAFKLSQNYPNPFNPSTQIQFQIPQRGYVSLIIYNILGKEITTLVKEQKEAGTHSIEFDASNLPSGVYIYTITSNGFMQAKKMILTK